MRRAAGIVGLLSIAGCGMLVGHALSYALADRTMADGRHGYFAPLLEAVLALALFCALVLVGRALRARGDRRLCETPPLRALWALLAGLQVAGFAATEYAEGNAPDAVGCGVQLVVALVVAVAVIAFLGFVERHVMASAGRYLRRLRTGPIAWHRCTDAVPATSMLATVVGFRRFQRPPPEMASPNHS